MSSLPIPQDWRGVDYDGLPAIQLKLLDAAASAFTTHGFNAASIDLIAHQANVTKGSVYYYYRSKGELFFAVHKRAMSVNLQAQIPIYEDGSLEPSLKLFRMVRQHALLMMEHLNYQKVVVQGIERHRHASTTPQEREAFEEALVMRRAYEDMFHQVIRSGVAAGKYVDANTSFATKAILGALNWITVWYEPRETSTPDFRAQLAEQMANQALFGIAIRPAGEYTF